MLPPDILEYSDYLLPFELLCPILIARIKDSALSSFSSFNKISAPINLTKEELLLLKSLSTNDSLITQKLDKMNSLPSLTRLISSNVNEGIRAVLFFKRKDFTHRKHKNPHKRTKTKKTAFLCA